MIAGFVFVAAMTAALAAPLTDGATSPPLADPLMIIVRGCHGDLQRHHVPEFRDTVQHRHRPGDCRPVPARQTILPLDCHRDARRHFVPGLGVVLHRHVGTDCAIRRINRSTEPKP